MSIMLFTRVGVRVQPPLLTVPSPSRGHELELSLNMAEAIFGLIITGLLVNQIPSFWFVGGSAGPSIPPNMVRDRLPCTLRLQSTLHPILATAPIFIECRARSRVPRPSASVP